MLGGQVAAARREHRWTLTELAERVGVTKTTMSKVERGDVTVGLGVAFEAAAILGVPLFSDDANRRRAEAARIDDHLTMLPTAVRKPTPVSDDF